MKNIRLSYIQSCISGHAVGLGCQNDEDRSQVGGEPRPGPRDDLPHRLELRRPDSHLLALQLIVEPIVVG